MDATASDSSGYLTNEQRLRLCYAALKRLTELTLAELEKDKREVESLDVVDQFYLVSHWSRLIKHIFRHEEKTTDIGKRLRVISEEFPSILPPASDDLKRDVATRLDWMKRRIAKDYERTFREVVTQHGVASPIEHIFLLEWMYQRIEERHDVKLKPQARMRTQAGDFVADFVITSGTEPQFSIVIEIDGHEFHEVTKVQVARDKRRERAIVCAGFTVLRFAGSEIFRDVRGCLQEIETVLSSRKKTAT
jgi:very-short-patch-repair endonuclease